MFLVQHRTTTVDLNEETLTNHFSISTIYQSVNDSDQVGEKKMNEQSHFNLIQQSIGSLLLK